LRFNGIPLKEEEAIYSKLKHLPQVIWIVKCAGEWDCMISCTVSTMSELGKTIESITSAAYPHVGSKAVSISTDIWSFSRSYLLKGKEKTAQHMGGVPLELDDIDLKLLRILSQDARKSVVAISQETGLSVKAITNHIKKLGKAGAINNFRLVINYEKSHIFFYKTFIYIKNPDERRLKELVSAINLHPHVVHNLKVIGEWSLEPEFEFENPDEFRKVRQELLNRFSDIIQDIRTVDVLKEYKYTFFHK
jgi:DNA-binding Lrp family transcriptional regulator